MGTFRTIMHPDGRELQFKTGNDSQEIHKIGDKIDWTPSPHYPGSGIDGVYESHSDLGQDDWIIIKDATIVAIEKRIISEDDEGEGENALAEKYGITPPDPSLWTKEQWDAKKKREEQSQKDFEEFMAKHNGNPMALFAYPISKPSHLEEMLPLVTVTPWKPPTNAS